jgi:hypothetical protein
MTIVFACACRRPIVAPDFAMGRPARCPGCGARVRVPAASDPRLATVLTVVTRKWAAPAPPIAPLQALQGGSPG